MKALDALFGNRVAHEDERLGLDIPEMGLSGYSDEQGESTGARPPVVGRRPPLGSVPAPGR